MEKQNNNDTGSTIDIMRIIQILLKRFWIIAICGLLAAGISFYYSTFFIKPTYSSNIKVFVNNEALTFDATGAKFTSSDLKLAKDLVSTYREVLVSRSTLERVAEYAEVEYSWKEIAQMITCKAVEDTAIIRVTVSCHNPYEASSIANSIADVLPVRVSEIFEGASMQVVDSAIPQMEKVAPNITNYSIIGFLIGALLAAAVIIISDILDDSIYDDDYVLKTYGYPILGKIPDLTNAGNKSYRYYSHSHNKSN